MSTDFQAFYNKELSTLKTKYEQKLLQINARISKISEFSPLLKRGARSSFSSPIKHNRIQQMNTRGYMNDSQTNSNSRMGRTVTIRKLCRINLMVGNTINSSIKFNDTDAFLHTTDKFNKEPPIIPRRNFEFVKWIKDASVARPRYRASIAVPSRQKMLDIRKEFDIQLREKPNCSKTISLKKCFKLSDLVYYDK